MASVKRERKDSIVCSGDIVGGQEPVHCSLVLAGDKLALDYNMHEVASETGFKITSNTNIIIVASGKLAKCVVILHLSLLSHYIFSCLHFQSMVGINKINMFALLS